MESSHKLSLDTRVTLLDKNLNPINTYMLPQEIEAPDDYIDVLVREANGEIIQQEKFPFRSFTRNFMMVFDTAFSQVAPPLQTTRSSGVKYQMDTTNDNSLLSFQGGYGAFALHDFGIQVGTGSTSITAGATVPMNWRDWKLLWPVTHSTIGTIDTLNYGLHTSDYLATSGTLRKYSIRRIFTNNAAGTVTIRECGILSNQRPSFDSFFVLMARDVFQYDGTPINIDVAQNKVLEVVYNFYVDTQQGWTDNFLLALGGVALTGIVTNVPLVPLTGYITNTTFAALTSYGAVFAAKPAVGQYPSGIIVGSGDSIPTTSGSYHLQIPIPHGTGTDQLSYGASSYSNFTASQASQSMQSAIIRRFTNNSGNTISVKEAGLVIAGSGQAYVNSTNLLIARKLIGTVNVLAGQSLDIAFIFNVSTSLVLGPYN